MTFIEGDFDNDSKEEVLDQLVAQAEEAFEGEFSEDEAVVVREFYDPVATYFATQQLDIKEVHDSTRLDRATDNALDFIGDRTGVTRRGARAATTDIEFISDTPVNKTFTIPKGQTVQTDDADPVVFETDKKRLLKFLDGFEDNDIVEYGGDTSAFTTQGTTVYDGTYALEGSAATGDIVDASNEVPQGSVLHFRVQLSANTSAGFLFGVKDTQTFYRVTADDVNGQIEIHELDGGTKTTLDTTVVTVPTASWLHGVVDWRHDGTITYTLYDSTGTEVATAEGISDLRDTGGIGFSSLDTNATKYFDNATLSSISVPATCTETGGVGNVGRDTLVVLGSTLNGVDSVTNPIPGTDGRTEEADDDYRVRIRTQLSEGSRASHPALIGRLDDLQDVKTVTVIANDDSTEDAAGRPSHSFESIVDIPSTDEAETAVAETILETKAAGDIPVGGFAGTQVSRTVTMKNGQSKTIEFSRPTQVKIYVDCSLSKTATYAGDEEVQDNIVRYIGGILNSNDTISGEIGVGEDVIYNQVLEAVMDVEGVFDISNLEVGTVSDPTATSNVSIASTETAFSDATDTSLEITSTDA